ncbi:MAG TPA: hypothetical protein VFO79_03655, partial [Xanthomonadales bacterium]|nr:hypothetical protein [Xanthomonadales bacterium]
MAGPGMSMTHDTASRTGAAHRASWRRRMPLTTVALVVCGLWALTQLLLPDDSAATAYALLWGRLPLLGLACYVGWRAVRANRAAPRAALGWGLMTAAIAVLIPADLYCGWLALVLGVAVEISAADVLYLSYFPLMLAGLLFLPRGFEGRLDVEKFVVDAAIITLG